MAPSLIFRPAAIINPAQTVSSSAVPTALYHCAYPSIRQHSARYSGWSALTPIPRVATRIEGETTTSGVFTHSAARQKLGRSNYVPWDQDERYCCCSLLKVSMRMPMELSFNFATQFSTSLGTS